MTTEKNPLDLNNFPDEYMVGAHCERWRDNNHLLKDSSIYPIDAAKCKRIRRADEGKEACGKVYECRFCSLKFCKSQALGGHMNRHRQERETETLNRARQLVYGNDSLAALNLGFRDPTIGAHAFSGSFHHDPSSSIAYMPSFTTRSSPQILSQPLHPFVCASPPLPSSSSSSSSSSTSTTLPSSSSHISSHLVPLHPSYHLAATPVNDYIVRHVINGSPHRNQQPRNSINQVFGGDSMNYFKNEGGSWN